MSILQFEFDSNEVFWFTEQAVPIKAIACAIALLAQYPKQSTSKLEKGMHMRFCVLEEHWLLLSTVCYINQIKPNQAELIIIPDVTHL